jgi:hypothetical protein
MRRRPAGSISPEITEFAAAVSFASPSGSPRHRPWPESYSSTCARLEHSSSSVSAYLIGMMGEGDVDANHFGPPA